MYQKLSPPSRPRDAKNPLYLFRIQRAFSFLCHFSLENVTFIKCVLGLYPLFYPLRVGHLFYELLHSGGAFSLHLRRGVCVSIQCKSRWMVAQILLNRFHVVPFFQGRNCIAVAEVVEAGIGNSDRGNDSLIVVIHRVGWKMVPQFICEHKVRILPQLPRL